MRKTLIGPRLRQLRREHKQTQAEMAKALGVSAAYVNLLENNQRSLSVKMLLALSDAYGVDWRDLIKDESSTLLTDLRNAVQDPIFGGSAPDLQELRAAIDHAPRVVGHFLKLYSSHRSALEKMMRLGSERMPDNLLSSSPETIIHDFFRDHANYFDELEQAAEKLRAAEPCDADDVYAMLKGRLYNVHGIEVHTAPVEEMSQALRIYDEADSVVHLSEALDHQNRVFQLAHVLCLVELAEVLESLTAGSGIRSESGLARCHVELANYFAAAFLMPYEPFHAAAERTNYDVDRIAAAFGVSFEQVCHRLTTLQREGAKGVPFFFLRVDKAGNVTKRFNATSFNLAEYGGACPVWNIHTSFRTPGVIVPQFVELPDGERFFTISRTTDRPVFSRDSQDRRLALSLGCELEHAHRLGYAAPFNIADDGLFSPIGINCHLCPRQACSQRAHQPLFTELPIDTKRRGNTRYES
ncbi:helix-turn-helix domain-containing protein [Pelagibius marinus]|uniref:helix-turn-helix domain-containing protein n=1 Tax=Pelagibius marinus TaxID=2762760 RepID=UPI0018723033|nr:XRE family transcriptional regulator [Pelagibius marinus]